MSLPINLFFSKSLGQYYLVDELVICSRCKTRDFSKSDDCCFVLRNYNNNKNVNIYTLCCNCYRFKLSELNDGLYSYSSFLPAKIVSDFDSLPFDVKIDKSNEFEFRDGKDINCPTVRDVAFSNKGVDADVSQCKLIDNTKFAGRESFDGFNISSSNVVELIDSKRDEFERNFLEYKGVDKI